MSPVISTSPDSQSFGTLGRFPIEIRNQIYEQLVCRQYAAAAYAEPSYPPPRDQRLTEGILTVSKAISHEVQEALYAKSIFSFDVHRAKDYLLTAPEGKINIRRMRNVQTSLFSSQKAAWNVGGRNESYPLFPWAKELRGGTFTIILHNDAVEFLLASYYKFGTLAFRRACLDARGASKVRIITRCSENDKVYVSSEEKQEARDICTQLMAKFLANLRPFMGPGRYETVSEIGAIYHGILEFLPHDFTMRP